MNNAIIMGRLTKDPELRYLQGANSSAVARFTVAVDKQLSREKKQEMESRNQPTADFINVVAWGRLAENVAKFTQKGKRVLVNGRIQTGSYQAQDGSRRYTTEIVANNVEFIDWKDSNDFSGGQAGYNQQNQNTGLSQQNAGTTDDFAGDDFEFGADFDPTSDDGRIPF